MQLPVRRLVLPALALVWLGLVGSASAVFPPPIKDDGKFFSAEALEKANKKIRSIYATYRKDVVIETYPEVPASLKDKYDEKDRRTFFRAWAKSRVRDLGVTGVYVQICKTPRSLDIEPDETTQRRGFSERDFKKTYQAFVNSFREEKFDKGLFDALEAIEAAYRANLK